MATTLKKGCEEGIVLYEDQQLINLFAKKNSIFNDLKEQATNKEKELQNFEDASDELLMLDDDENVPYDMGEVFVMLSGDQVQKQLESRKSKIETELVTIREETGKVEEELKKLKSQLYAKFGTNINLEAPDN